MKKSQSDLISISDCMKCWNCETKLDIKGSYDIHINGKTSKCSKCSNINKLESIIVLSVIKKYNVDRYEMLSYLHSYYPEQIINKYSKFEDLFKWIRTEIEKKNGTFRTVDRSNLLNIVKKYGKLTFFGMDLIKGMYRQLNFANKICCNFNYWSNIDSIKTSIHRYRKFINLMVGVDKILVPTVDIDLI